MIKDIATIESRGGGEIMQSVFTIGETAKIHHISKQTLIFYDKKGLLKPAYVDKNNGYRYYSLEEFAALDVILFLKFSIRVHIKRSAKVQISVRKAFII